MCLGLDVMEVGVCGVCALVGWLVTGLSLLRTPAAADGGGMYFVFRVVGA